MIDIVGTLLNFKSIQETGNSVLILVNIHIGAINTSVVFPKAPH